MRIYIGERSYDVTGKTADARRNAAWRHRNAGHDKNKTIEQIMRMARVKK